MKKMLLCISVFLSSMIFSGLTSAQTYHEDDKEGLRIILREDLGGAAAPNLLVAGLTIADTALWQQDEGWISKIKNPNGRNACVWNNETPKRLIELSFENGTQRQMMGKFDCSFFSELTRLVIAGNYFDELTSLPSGLKELFCYDNRIKDIDIFWNSYLEVLDCRNNKLKHIDFSQNFNLQYIDCSKNQLTYFNPPSGSDLMFVDISENNLKFSVLPDLNIASYSFAPQNPIVVGSLPANETIDLSSEYVIYGSTTSYKWYKENGVHVNVIDSSGGKFVPGDELAGEKLICRMTNEYFPQLTLEYKVNVTDPVYFIYDERDKEGLRFFLRQLDENQVPRNLHILGLSLADTLSWYESEDWIDKIQNRSEACLWNEEMPKRITGLWLNMTPGVAPLIGILDCTPFAKLTTLECNDNMLTFILLYENQELKSLSCANNTILNFLDLSNNVNLEFLDCSYNKLQPIDFSGNIHLKELRWTHAELWYINLEHNSELIYLNLSNNRFKEINLSLNSHLTVVDLNNNDFRKLVLTDKMYLTTLYCNSNQLDSIDLSNNPNLHILNIADNYFKFSTLPAHLYPGTIYAPQKSIDGGFMPANGIIDLSSEYSINGNITSYEWYEVTGTPLSVYDMGGGKFIAGTQHIGKHLMCKMTNNLRSELQLYYYVMISDAVPELLTDHLTLVESPQTDYYTASSGQTFKIKANTSVDPELVKIGLFKTTGSFMEEISFERINDIYTCCVSGTTASGSYLIQAYTVNIGDNILRVLKRPEESHLIDILPFAFTKTSSTYSSNPVMSHLVLNTSAKNLYKVYIDTPFRVVVNIASTVSTRIGLFDLYGELVEDITQSVSGKIFTCQVSYSVFPDNYIIMPYVDTPLGPQFVERSLGAAVMDRLPLAVDYDWQYRNAAFRSEQVESKDDATGVSIFGSVSVSLMQDVLYVYTQENVKTIEIFDINGKLVKKAESVTNISVSDLPGGIYIAKINTMSETVTHKFMKN